MSMYSPPINGVGAVIALTGMSFIFISFVMRLFIFFRQNKSSAIKKQLSSASIIGFGDSLSLGLWRLRYKLSGREKFFVLAFFYLQVAGAMLLTGGITYAAVFD